MCSFLPLDADALVLVALCCDHDISLVKHKYHYLLGVYEFEFTAPVQHGTWCANNNLFLQLHAPLHWNIHKKQKLINAESSLRCSHVFINGNDSNN